jgi:hypothetical protein
MSTKINGEFTLRTEADLQIDAMLQGMAKDLLNVEISNWHWHSQVFMKRHTLSRLTYYYDIYKKIVDVPGVIMEFGVQYGAIMSTLIALRGMLEPYNYSRKIIGFDTFSGFPSVSPMGHDKNCEVGMYKVKEGWVDTLSHILQAHEQMSPVNNIKKFELVQGDACVTVPEYIAQNPATVIALAIFDFDLYKPTKVALEQVIPRLTKGSILMFDELNCPHMPGETMAVLEQVGLNNLRLRCDPNQPYRAYAVFE